MRLGSSSMFIATRTVDMNGCGVLPWFVDRESLLPVSRHQHRARNVTGTASAKSGNLDGVSGGRALSAALEIFLRDFARRNILL